jgi:hypothetical protein
MKTKTILAAKLADDRSAATGAEEIASNASGTDFEAQVEEHLRLFPYQKTYRYAMLQTGGDPAKLNTWLMASRDLLKAGKDTVVRSNNDTLYKMAWVYLGQSPVVLGSASPSSR